MFPGWLRKNVATSFRRSALLSGCHRCIKSYSSVGPFDRGRGWAAQSGRREVWTSTAFRVARRCGDPKITTLNHSENIALFLNITFYFALADTLSLFLHSLGRLTTAVLSLAASGLESGIRGQLWMMFLQTATTNPAQNTGCQFVLIYKADPWTPPSTHWLHWYRSCNTTALSLSLWSFFSHFREGGSSM